MNSINLAVIRHLEIRKLVEEGDLPELKKRRRYNCPRPVIRPDYLLVASRHGQYQMMMYLYSRLDDSDLTSSLLEVSLEHAMRKGHWLIVKFLAGKLARKESGGGR